MAEQLTCNQQVAGSSPIASSIKNIDDFGRATISAMAVVLDQVSLVINSGLSHGGIPEWPKGTDCKSVVGRLRRFESSSLHHTITGKWQ